MSRIITFLFVDGAPIPSERPPYRPRAQVLGKKCAERQHRARNGRQE
jgi:hypothetical protein